MCVLSGYVLLTHVHACGVYMRSRLTHAHLSNLSNWCDKPDIIVVRLCCEEKYIGDIILERAGKHFESTGVKTAFVPTWASVACCFTLRVCLMNRFFPTAFIVALAIRELLSDSAVRVFLMICVHVFVRFLRATLVSDYPP